MKVFIRYRALRSNGQNLKNNYPARYTNLINNHWDSSCRPDPDFDPDYPSTGLCRSPAIQNFLSSNSNSISAIYYFYVFKTNNQRHIAIIGKFIVDHVSTAHSYAYNWFIAKGFLNYNIPLNVAVNNQNIYRNCLDQNHTQQQKPDNVYFRRSNNKFIHLKWSRNRLSSPLIMTESSFISTLMKRNATLLNPNNKFTNLNQLQNSAIII